MAERVKLDETTESGFWLGVERTITKARYGVYTFPNTGEKSKAVFLLESTVGGGAPHVDMFSYGSQELFKPSNSGKSLDILGTPRTPYNTTAYMMFLASLYAAGFPKNTGEDISMMEGISFIGDEVPNTNATKDKDSQYYVENPVYRVVGKITNMPGEGSGETDVEAEAVGLVLKVLADAGGSLEITELLPPLFNELKGNKNRKEIVQLVSEQKFLESQGSWSITGDVITVD